jgi:hypothetical protein
VASASDARQMRISTGASTSVARPRPRIALTAELDLKPRMQVYAPGVAGYTAVEWKLEEVRFSSRIPSTIANATRRRPCLSDGQFEGLVRHRARAQLHRKIPQPRLVPVHTITRIT